MQRIYGSKIDQNFGLVSQIHINFIGKSSEPEFLVVLVSLSI